MRLFDLDFWFSCLLAHWMYGINLIDLIVDVSSFRYMRCYLGLRSDSSFFLQCLFYVCLMLFRSCFNILVYWLGYSLILNFHRRVYLWWF